MKKLLTCNAAILAVTVIVAGAGAPVAQAAGLQAELRSAAAILPAAIPGAVAPTAPAGGVAIGAQPWTCDARQGFAPVVAGRARCSRSAAGDRNRRRLEIADLPDDRACNLRSVRPAE